MKILPTFAIVATMFSADRADAQTIKPTAPGSHIRKVEPFVYMMKWYLADSLRQEFDIALSQYVKKNGSTYDTIYVDFYSEPPHLLPNGGTSQSRMSPGPAELAINIDALPVDRQLFGSSITQSLTHVMMGEPRILDTAIALDNHGEVYAIQGFNLLMHTDGDDIVFPYFQNAAAQWVALKTRPKYTNTSSVDAALGQFYNNLELRGRMSYAWLVDALHSNHIEYILHAITGSSSLTTENIKLAAQIIWNIKDIWIAAQSREDLGWLMDIQQIVDHLPVQKK